MPVFEGLGKALRWLRANQDRRQYEVASAAGITKAMLSAYETGKQRPSLETLEKVLEALGADLADLHDALLILNDRQAPAVGSRRPSSSAVRALARGADAPEINVYSALGLDHPLPAEEERAFAEMLSGFHRLIRYMHRSLSDASADASSEGGGSGSRGPRASGRRGTDDPADG